MASRVGISPHSKFSNVTSELTHLTLTGQKSRKLNDRLGIAWLFAALVSLFLGQIGAV